MTTKLRTIEYPHRRAVWGALSFLALMVVLYIYFVNSIIMGVVARERMIAAIGDLRTEVTTLESRYVALASTITLDRAYALGLQEVEGASDFAYRESAPTSHLTYNSY